MHAAEDERGEFSARLPAYLPANGELLERHLRMYRDTDGWCVHRALLNIRLWRSSSSDVS